MRECSAGEVGGGPQAYLATETETQPPTQPENPTHQLPLPAGVEGSLSWAWARFELGLLAMVVSPTGRSRDKGRHATRNSHEPPIII